MRVVGCTFADNYEGAFWVVHETGHFFRLYHTFGGCTCGDCNYPSASDDGLSDTLPEGDCWSLNQIAVANFGGTSYADLPPDLQRKMDDTYYNVLSYHNVANKDVEENRMTAGQASRPSTISCAQFSAKAVQLQFETGATRATPVLLWLALFFGLSTLNSQLSTAFAQSYSIDWYTIDGGGGTSTGGVYSVSGTIGQPDSSGPMTNGQYSVTGGFWALPTVIQTEGVPTLTIAPASPSFANISWTPAAGTNWVLQERLSLSTGSWTTSPSGWTNPITVSATLPAKFYRLIKP